MRLISYFLNPHHEASMGHPEERAGVEPTTAFTATLFESVAHTNVSRSIIPVLKMQ